MFHFRLVASALGMANEKQITRVGVFLRMYCRINPLQWTADKNTGKGAV
jgi:hypothetical protein